MELTQLLKPEQVDFFQSCGITTAPPKDNYERTSSLGDLPLGNPCQLVSFFLACLTRSEEVEYSRTITITNPLGSCKKLETLNEKIASIKDVILEGLRLCSQIPANSTFPADELLSIAIEYLSVRFPETPSLKIRHIVHIGDIREDALIFCYRRPGIPGDDDGEVLVHKSCKIYVLQSNTFVVDESLDFEAF